MNINRISLPSVSGILTRDMTSPITIGSRTTGKTVNKNVNKFTSRSDHPVGGVLENFWLNFWVALEIV